MIKVKHSLVSGIALASVLLAACGADKKAEEAKLESLESKVSYMFGTNMASQFKQEGFQLDANAIALAINDVQAGKESRISEEEMQQVMQDFQAKAQAQQEEKFNAVAEGNLKESETFLAENAQKEGVQTTESGLQYKVVAEGEGDKPTTADSVTVHYKGTLIDGTEFDSSYSRGEPVSFPVTGVIPGWTEALQLMSPGAKYELYIPSDLAYGPGGTGPIGPNQALIFEVELLSVEASEDKEAAAK
ncbi:FKBP-type peptidyl-prolyl cis-trans isomerase [Simiduia sp. 21SJ11W-1]|uniref:FKBP-type peptidyl-prolyl cis-trans isomerase n=1 Tax=Simiduia sp. 21SJ11W-1 TaxID=2909669 RepID=UPI00209DF8B8|nr:FKBP-type peptidyl-prolyl cis-trans isomerase [Simiduia sp. 21SJ11W-1]UTA48026.1 FKBP-type peptidyl-prolyl cis-trans isomerase [Simiduia sp. 21SJ11W-1]